MRPPVPRRSPRRRDLARGRERGAAALELALVLPLLLLFVGGITDFGSALSTLVQLSNASREGARIIVVEYPTKAASDVGTDAVARAKASAPGATLTVGVTMCTASGTDAKVTATAPVSWPVLGSALGMVGASGALPATLSSTAVMRC